MHLKEHVMKYCKKGIFINYSLLQIRWPIEPNNSQNCMHMLGYTPSENTGLWQFPIVSSAFKVNNLLSFFIKWGCWKFIFFFIMTGSFPLYVPKIDLVRIKRWWINWQLQAKALPANPNAIRVSDITNCYFDITNLTSDWHQNNERKRHPCCTLSCPKKALGLNFLNIWVRNYLFLKNNVTSEGAVSHDVSHQQLSISRQILLSIILSKCQ